jgi:Protein of unknown function (DUF1364)
MSALTKLARNRPCLVRLPGCSGGGEDTVGAHYRSVSLGAGVAFKTSDLLVAWCCYSCHQIVDGANRLADYTHDQIRLAHAEGVLRTLNELVRIGKVKA